MCSKIVRSFSSALKAREAAQGASQLCSSAHVPTRTMLIERNWRVTGEELSVRGGLVREQDLQMLLNSIKE